MVDIVCKPFSRFVGDDLWLKLPDVLSPITGHVLEFLKLFFKIILLYGAKTWTTTKREDRIRATEFKLLRTVLNKTKSG